MSGWSSFLEVEPLTGRRHVEASERRTRQDWARWIRSMLTERYPQAERVVLVLDNLNTHGIESLYASYPPEQARAQAERLEIHYTAQARQLAQHRRDRVERPGRPMPQPVDARPCHRSSPDARLGAASEQSGGHRRLAVHHLRCSHQAENPISENLNDKLY